jgi:hypothetical protein
LGLRGGFAHVPLVEWTMLAYRIFVFAQAMLEAKLY